MLPTFTVCALLGVMDAQLDSVSFDFEYELTHLVSRQPQEVQRFGERRNRRWGKNSRDAPDLMPRVPETPRPLGYSLCAAFGRKNSQDVYNSGIASNIARG